MSNRQVDFILQKLHNLYIHDCQVIFKRNCDIFRAFLTMYWHKNRWRKHIFLLSHVSLFFLNYLDFSNNLSLYVFFFSDITSLWYFRNIFQSSHSPDLWNFRYVSRLFVWIMNGARNMCLRHLFLCQYIVRNALNMSQRKVKDYLKSLDSLKRIKKHVRVQFSQNGCRVNHGFNLQKCSCFVRPEMMYNST
jgi:hypothetical protein